MTKPRLFYFFILALLVSIPLILGLPDPTSASPINQEQDHPLRVVTKQIPPFVFKNQERLTGFSIDIWKEIALTTNTPFEFLEVETVNEQLAYLKQGQADVAIAAISMTPEREEDIDFSYPYYRSGLQILTNTRQSGPFLGFLAAFVTTRLLAVIGGLLLVMVVVGHLVWLAERKDNPDFPRKYGPGVWEGLWWSAVTMTTVGYGDKRVKGVWGRILGMFWMFSGIFLIANFTAGVTAELTVSEISGSINSIEDLVGREVTTVIGTTSAEFLNKQRIPFTGVRTIDDAYLLFESGQVEAIVYDAPVLQYYASTADRGSVQVVGQLLKPEDYGIALPPGSPHEEEINQALLKIISSGAYQEIHNRWFSMEE